MTGVLNFLDLSMNTSSLPKYFGILEFVIIWCYVVQTIFIFIFIFLEAIV